MTENKRGLLRTIAGILIYTVLTAVTVVMFTSIARGAVEDEDIPISKYVVVVKDGEASQVYATDKETVGELFEENNISLREKDKLSANLSDRLTQGMVITIKRAENISFLIDGKVTQTIYMNASTVGEALAFFRQETGTNYTLAKGVGAAQSLSAFETIPVISAYEKVETRTSDIYFQTETVENPDMNEGESRVISEGVNGKKELTVRVSYVDGEAVDTEVIRENIIKAPINKVVEVGTKKPYQDLIPVAEAITPSVSIEDFQDYIVPALDTSVVVDELEMNATAYSKDYACTGKSPGMKNYGITASGMWAQYGVVAVDPSVIPLGTKLYVEGYGYCIAGDTGGAIKGNKIDLCFNSYGEAINYGRKNVKVYILA